MSIPTSNAPAGLGVITIDTPVGHPGVRVRIDDQEIPEIVDLSLSAPLDGIVQLRALLNVRTGFKLEAKGGIVIAAVVMPGYRLIEETDPATGTKTYRGEADQPRGVT